MENPDTDHELTFVSLSGPAEALHRATESGSGMLATGRPWVRQEGWLLKESSGLGGGWQLRYFVVAGDRLEYFTEEVTKLSLRPGERLGVDVDKGNLVSRAAPGGAAASQRALAENDVVIGLNGESLVRTPFSAALDAQRRAGAANLAFTILRPKGKIMLHGGAVGAGGARKQGGHTFTVTVSEGTARRTRYVLVCGGERACAGWVASIKEAIAAAAMTPINAAISQALEMQAVVEESQRRQEAMTA